MKWKKLIEKAIVTRRELHRIPEPCWNEYKTSEYVRTRLGEIGVDCRKCAGTGVVAYIAQGKSGGSLALRADMDGLVVEENEGLPWMSTIPGQMHGCGHDGHMATMLATAEWLKNYEAELATPVTLIFQPAEEGGHGAREMIADSCLDGVNRIFGWHNWPSIPFGQAVCPDGPIMAANASFEIVLHGSGGHASQPELCRDPVLAAAAVALGLQQIVSRRLSPQQAAVVSVTSIDARSGETVIPEKASLLGSVRLDQTSGLELIGELIKTTATAIASGYGVEAEFHFIPRYPAVINRSEEAGLMRSVLQRYLGRDWLHNDTQVPIMASEDFSYYLEKIPGAFALVGAGDGGRFSTPCHNRNYDFNDRLIAPMVQVMIELAGLQPPLSSGN